MADPLEAAPGVFVFASSLYTTTTTVIAGTGGGCLVIDPAMHPSDLSDLGAWLAARGLRPVAGWSTHPHWDHVLWSAALGADVPRYATPAAADGAARRRDTMLAHAEAEAPGHDPSLFGRLTAWAPGTFSWDGPEARVIAHDAHERGHGALFFPETGVLVAGDMLSDIEIPLVDTESEDPFGIYRSGLEKVAALTGVRVVVPGHGHPGDGAAFRARAAADRAYLDSVEAGGPVTDPRLARTWLRQEHLEQAPLARRTR